MKYYFESNKEDANCWTLNHWKEKAENEQRDIILLEAKIEYGTDYFYCDEYLEFGLTSESECGVDCKAYKPRNGKSGRCIHHKNCYIPTDKQLIVTKEGKVERTTK